MNVNEDSLALRDVEKAARLDSLNAKYAYALGYLYLESGQPGKAILTLQKNLKLTPGNTNVRLLLSRAYIANNNIAAAQEQVDKVLAAAPRHPDALFWQARIKASQKDTAAAIAIAKQILTLDSNNYAASMQLADWYSAQNKDEAIRQYEYTFRLDTNDVAPLYEIGAFYEGRQQWKEAKNAYRTCILNDPDYTDAYIQAGKIMYRQDSTEKALRQFNFAIRTDPDNAEAYLQKGLCFEQLKQKDSAIVAFSQALAFKKDMQPAREGLKRLR